MAFAFTGPIVESLGEVGAPGFHGELGGVLEEVEAFPLAVGGHRILCFGLLVVDPGRRHVGFDVFGPDAAVLGIGVHRCAECNGVFGVCIDRDRAPELLGDQLADQRDA